MAKPGEARDPAGRGGDGAGAIHPWFRCRGGGATVTSHNGSSNHRSESGTRTAFVRAHRAGYRWMQVDVVPIADDLLSRHAVFGRSFRYGRRTRAEMAARLPDVPTLYELVTDPALAGTNWNVELKTKTGLPELTRTLQRLRAEGHDLSRLLVSSPVRPSLLDAVAQRFPEVAVAAPLVHGGVFGVPWSGRSRARTSVGPYHCRQVHHRLVRPGGRGGPVTQAWTVANRRVLDRTLRLGAHPIVTPSALTIRRQVITDQSGHAAASGVQTPPPPRPEVLALGGGGWRGAFGGIGAVMYLTDRGLFSGVHDIVGISGGSFTVAALSRQHPGTDDDDGHVAPLRQFLASMEGAGRQTLSILVIVAAALALLVAVGAVAQLNAFNHEVSPATLWLLPLLAMSSFAIRATVALRWKLILRGLFGTDTMASGPVGDDPNRPRRRYAIGATGLHDGRLYAFTSDPDHDVGRWLDERTRPERPELAVPLGGHRLADIVARATSLPGVGQLGLGRICLPICDHGPGRRSRIPCQGVPDRLVDGGVSGIFGRGLIQGRSRVPNASGPTEVVVVDAGRRLTAERPTLSGRVTRGAQRSSALVLLGRWLKVAMDVAYREELRHVRDGNVVDGYRYRLVRLAEEEHPFDPATGLVRDPTRITVARGDDLNRLYVLRDRVHEFSLMRVNRANINRTIAVAVAACALEFEHEPDIPTLLRSVGRRLGRGDQLAQVWDDVRVPLLRQPLQLGPPQVKRPEPLDLGPGRRQPALGGR